MNDAASSTAFGLNPWADFWLNTQRRYWESWRKAAGRDAGPAPAARGQAAGDFENPWLQVWDAWFGLMAPAGGAARPAAGPENYAGVPGPWTDAWFQAQRGYWDFWLGIMAPGRHALGPRAAEPFGQAMAFWSRWFWPMAPESSRDWLRGVLDLNRFHARMAETAWRLLAGNGAAAHGATQPWEVFGAGLSQWRDQFAASLGGGNPWAGFGNFWGMPLDNWRRVCSAFSMLPGDMEKAARGFGSPYGPETLHQTMVGMLSMPTVGYTREWQEEMQRWGLLWLDFSRAWQAYAGVLGRIVVLAFDRFARALAERAGGGELDSLRDYYNLWIDCSEEAYAEVSVSPDFVEAQGRLTNSLFAIKRQEQKMLEEFQAALNMPTRRELDTSHRRVHQLQRRVWDVEQALEESAAPDVHAELAALRRELEALRAGLETGGTRPVGPRRGAGLKSTP